MKRKGRKSRATESVENGENTNPEENGDALEDEPVAKRKSRGGKRSSVSLNAKNASPKKAANTEADATEESENKSSEEDAQYEVESVLDEKNIRGVRHYLIRWKGYEPESDTWEPEPTLSCAELIAEFHAKKKKKGGAPSSAKSTPSKSPTKSPKKRSKKESGDSREETEWDENENFEVDRILEVHFCKNGTREFLVSWKGYPHSQDSWEPEANMDCHELIDKFMAKVDRAKETEQRELRVKRPHTDRFTLSMVGSGRRISKRNQGKQRIHYHDAE